MKISEIQARLIEKTKYPLAPFVMQNVADATEQFARMLAGMTTKEETDEIVKKLVQAFPDYIDDKLNPIFGNPAFCMALCGMLKQSSIRFVQQL